MSNCVICGNPITEDNISSEHIIHNAIGGILEDEHIYCKTCNGKYGTNEDKAFTDIFIPFVEGLKVRKNRKTKGTPYTGIMYDQDGNLYHIEYKAGKVWTVRDSEGKFVGHQASPDMVFGGYDFKLDNDAFKAGISKIAFNYAIHCGIKPEMMNKLFDNDRKSLVYKPIIFPFIPMTPFDAIMEAQEPERLFHALRLFNINNILYAYVELFSTFQFYVVVSDNYRADGTGFLGNIDNKYCNYIVANEKADEELLKDLTPYSPKDADIIMTQYRISKDDAVEKAKRSPEYDSDNKSSNWALICAAIGDIAYNKCRTAAYEKDYGEVINQIYDKINFVELMKDIMEDSFNSKDLDSINDFTESFQFYTVYDDDCVNIDYYKQILPDGRAYPEKIYKSLLQKNNNAAEYTKSKFRMLSNRLSS